MKNRGKINLMLVAHSAGYRAENRNYHYYAIPQAKGGRLSQSIVNLRSVPKNLKNGLAKAASRIRNKFAKPAETVFIPTLCEAKKGA